MKSRARIVLLCAALTASLPFAFERAAAETNNVAALKAASERAEQIRADCIANRRRICGRVLEVTPDGLVVESGYTNLLESPFNHDWLTRANAAVPPRPKIVEGTEANAIAVGNVFLTDIPRRPKVRQYDYVVLTGYLAGFHTYEPVKGVSKPLRRFTGGLETAVTLRLATAPEKRPSSP